MAFDVETVRATFPILSRTLPNGRELAYFDSGATAQKPQCVIDRITEFYQSENSNIHRGIHFLSSQATVAYEAAREAIGNYLQIGEDQVVVFTSGTTESVNLVAHGLSFSLKAGDEIIVTLMEHHANFVPWQLLASRIGVTLRFVPVLENGELDMIAWQQAFNENTKLAAFTAVSNVLGTVNPIHEMVDFAKQRGVLTLVDGAQEMPHKRVNLAELGADFYTFSGHKVFGPDGIGVLVGYRQQLSEMEPYQGGGDMIDQVSVKGTTFREAPERFEAGTPNIAAAIGLGAAVEYLSQLDWQGAHAHEQQLLKLATEAMQSIEGLKIWGTVPQKEAVISFTMTDAHPQDIATILDNVGVAIRTGHHCAQPLMEHFGITGTARASIAFYNNEADVQALIEGLKKVQSLFTF